MKEVWEVQQPLDRVIHTMGWPLKFAAKYREFGGSFIYPMGEDKVSMGLVVGLDYRDARFSVHDALQELKSHPIVAQDHRGRQAGRLGREDDPVGRLLGAPRRLWAPGMALVGDGAGMVNVPTLKGVHYAMHAGMFAAEAIYERLKAGGNCDDLSNYQAKVAGSEIETDRYRSRNMRQPFAKGFFVGGAIAEHDGRSPAGAFPGGHWATHDDATVPSSSVPERDYPKPDGKVTFDKLSSVFATGNATRDDAPNHIRIQEKVPLEVALMWQNMCPAQVYEVPDEELEAAQRQRQARRQARGEAQITPSNCVQCGAITAKGGRLTPPEGGDGPADRHPPGEPSPGLPSTRWQRRCRREGDQSAWAAHGRSARGATWCHPRRHPCRRPASIEPHRS